jgi:phosphoribosylformimino-5-aminoimidazole carboxamide ribotide isomerase
LKVIPVIDVLDGLAVHAVRGRRQEYKPLHSTLCKSVEPIEVAKAFKTLGFNEIYIADLDGITKGKVNFQILKQIVDETGLKLMVDAGAADLETAKKLLKTGVSKVVIGTETLQNKSFVCDAVKVLGNEKVMVSLDLKGEKVLVKLGFAGCKDSLCLLREFHEMGVSNVIVLDLTRVGSNEGVNVDFLKKALSENMDIYVGGGVRDIKDLIMLKNLGVSGALVATALHSNKISIAELEQNGLL